MGGQWGARQVSNNGKEKQNKNNVIWQTIVVLAQYRQLWAVGGFGDKYVIVCRDFAETLAPGDGVSFKHHPLATFALRLCNQQHRERYNKRE